MSEIVALKYKQEHIADDLDVNVVSGMICHCADSTSLQVDRNRASYGSYPSKLRRIESTECMHIARFKSDMTSKLTFRNISNFKISQTLVWEILKLHFLHFTQAHF